MAIFGKSSQVMCTILLPRSGTVFRSHYNVTVPLTKSERKTDRLWGPAQMAVVLCEDDQTLVHFENYLDGNPILS